MSPNHSYQRSTRRERELVNEYRAKGYMSCRSAGSHSPFDVWAFNPDTAHLVLIQVKTKLGQYNKVIKGASAIDGVKAEMMTVSWE